MITDYLPIICDQWHSDGRRNLAAGSNTLDVNLQSNLELAHPKEDRSLCA